MNPKPVLRRYDLDWLRVLAILVVFVYHSTRFFNLGIGASRIPPPTPG